MNRDEELHKIRGMRVKECRNAVGLTQKQLAEKSGYSASLISAVERIDAPIEDRRTLSTDVAFAIAKVLNVSPDYLLGKSDYKTDEELVSTFETMLNQREKKLNSILNAYMNMLGYSYLGMLIKDENGKIYALPKGIKTDRFGNSNLEYRSLYRIYESRSGKLRVFNTEELKKLREELYEYAQMRLIGLSNHPTSIFGDICKSERTYRIYAGRKKEVFSHPEMVIDEYKKLLKEQEM